MASADLPPSPASQRIDKWIWHARLVRTRHEAAELAGRGAVRVNGQRITAPGRKVSSGDVLTVALRHVRVLRVKGFAERRGDAAAARALYEDLDPLPARPGGAASPEGEEGTGRELFRNLPGA
ncbi:MAG TPA: S4 domain-containing protein [Pseudorhodoplanes sp.]|jgi:ribosome-associated heat shock protein Hsp15|nr:S4 domain-containing protein [Pseudorhodoplanes sp.]